MQLCLSAIFYTSRSQLTSLLDIYYISFPDDPKIRKYLVTGVYLFEIVQTVMTCNDAFKLFASGWGNPAVVDDAGLLWFYVPVITESSEFGTSPHDDAPY